MVAQIRPLQFLQWLAQSQAQSLAQLGDQALVLDVRESHELLYARLQPDGFALLHMPMHTVPARLHEMDKNRPIACLCHHGGRSMQVAHFLQQQGFTQVVNIEGGIHAWAQEIDPSIPLY